MSLQEQPSNQILQPSEPTLSPEAHNAAAQLVGARATIERYRLIDIQLLLGMLIGGAISALLSVTSRNGLVGLVGGIVSYVPLLLSRLDKRRRARWRRAVDLVNRNVGIAALPLLADMITWKGFDMHGEVLAKVEAELVWLLDRVTEENVGQLTAKERKSIYSLLQSDEGRCVTRECLVAILGLLVRTHDSVGLPYVRRYVGFELAGRPEEVQSYLRTLRAEDDAPYARTELLRSAGAAARDESSLVQPAAGAEDATGGQLVRPPFNERVEEYQTSAATRGDHRAT